MTQAMTVQNKKNIRKNRKGFTLIELIVVIAILAILAAIAIPAFSNTLTNAKLKTDQASARVIASAVQLYRAEYADSDATPNKTALAAFVEEWPTPQSGDEDDDFDLNYSSGSLEITVGETKVYPAP
jgi:prepilin-type N-terminal cleavage/methylation domain-containing protein